MYQGTKFTRDQLSFVIETIFTAALDRIEAILPTSIGHEDWKRLRKSGEAESWINASIETAGMAIAVLYAQLTDDGIGIGDALQVAGKFDECARNWAFGAWTDKGQPVKSRMRVACDEQKHMSFVYPDMPVAAQHAEIFIKACFDQPGHVPPDYLQS